jgi:hypothetical protein
MNYSHYNFTPHVILNSFQELIKAGLALVGLKKTALYKNNTNNTHDLYKILKRVQDDSWGGAWHYLLPVQNFNKGSIKL